MGARIVRALYDAKVAGAGEVPPALKELSDDDALTVVVEMVATLRRARAVLGGAVGGDEVKASEEWELVQLARVAANRVHKEPTMTPQAAVETELVHARAFFSSATTARLYEPELRAQLVRAVAWKSKREKPPPPPDGTKVARWLEPLFEMTVVLGWEAKPAPGYEGQAVAAWSRRLPAASVPLDEGEG